MAFSDDVEINSFESVPEPESIPPDEEGDELMLSRMVAASKISSKVPGRNTFTKYNNSLNPLNSFLFQSSSSAHSGAASEVLKVYKKSGRSGGDLAEFAPERAIIKAMCNVVLKSLPD